MQKSKSVWVGAVMVLIGLGSMAFPDYAQTLGATGDPLQMIGTGLGIVFLRFGIAKKADQ